VLQIGRAAQSRLQEVVELVGDPARLGEPIHIRAKRNGIRSTARRLGAASSILFYMGVHDVDAMQWIGRSRVARVYARKREVLGTGNEDVLYAVLEFENGAIGSLDYSWAWPDGLMNGFRSAFEIVGTRTAAALDVSDQGLYFTDDAGTIGGDTHLWPEINGRIGGSLGGLVHLYVAGVKAQDVADHQPYAVALDSLDDAPRRGGVVRERLL
jgi:predicted dehydrogenase